MPHLPYDQTHEWTVAHRNHRPPAIVEPAGDATPPGGGDARFLPHLDQWTASGGQAAARQESITMWRLNRLRRVAGTTTWRAEQLVQPTIDYAVEFVSAFESVAGADIRARVAPVEGGGILIEWERGSRELHVEVLPDGTTEHLLIRDGVEEGEGADIAPAILAQWLLSS